MEKKNTILLTVIAVATLLVAVVGATFAYFTATNSTEGTGANNTTVNTAQVGSVKVKLDTVGKTVDGKAIYPGSVLYAASSVNAKLEGTDTNAPQGYTVNYTVSGKVTMGTEEAPFAFGGEWALYELDAAAVNAADASDVVSCKVVTTPAGKDVQYSEQCALSSSFVAAGENVTKVAGGTIAAGTVETPVTYNGSVNTGTEAAGNNKYYYLVVTYTNVEDQGETSGNQNADKGKAIVASIDSITVSSTVKTVNE